MNMSEGKESSFSPIMKSIKDQINKLPISAKSKKKMMTKLSDIKELAVDAREPRIALVGRRGAGKSTLINAIFGEKRQLVSPVQAGTGTGSWLWYPDEAHRKIKLLDTRGLGDSEAPIEVSEAATAFEEVEKAVREEQPDVFLFLIKAKETDARIEEDLKELHALRAAVREAHNYDVPVICAVTQVDELDPPYYRQLPLDGDRQKAENIRKSVELMERRFRERNIPLLKVIPVNAYADFNERGEIVYDLRWNIDSLSTYLVESLPNEAKLKTAKAMQAAAAKKKVADKVVKTIAGIAGLLGLEPIPMADMPLLTALQGLMIMIIAYISGRDLSKKTAMEFIGAIGANIGLGFAVREGVRSAVKLIPAAGNMISGAVAATVTYGIGQAGIAYFIEGRELNQAKSAYKKGKKNYHPK